jgi:hypothetical protein
MAIVLIVVLVGPPGEDWQCIQLVDYDDMGDSDVNSS